MWKGDFTKNKRRRSKNKARKLLVKGLVMAWPILLELFLIIRLYMDKFINFIFGLYWDTSKQVLPGLNKHTFLNESAVQIAKKIRTKELTSEEVVQAYINRINEVNPIINAVTDERNELALKEARDIDAKIAKGEYSHQDFKAKPLLGVPFSSKDSTAAEGCLHTLGLVSRKSIRADEDAEVIKLAKQAGGILLVTTNVPEVNKWQETYNNVFGLTCNPYNTTRTVGGSSGGEGALVTSCGTAWGLGTDIGGSIRMPAFYCGLYGHKPSSGITNMKGCTFRTGTETDTMVQAGPLTRYAEDLAPLLTMLAGDQAKKLKLQESVDIRRLKVFYVEDSHEMRCSSVDQDLKEVLQKVVSNLNVGSQPQAVHLEGIEHTFRLWRYWMTQEPADFNALLSNGTGKISGVKELLKKLVGQSKFTMASILSLLDASLLKAEDAKWAQTLTNKLQTQLKDILGNDGILIYPSTTFPAPYHYSAFLRPFNFSYWCLFNVLHLPVTQVPLGLNSDGLPLGIQIAAGPFNDHLCIAAAKEIERLFGGWVPPFQMN